MKGVKLCQTGSKTMTMEGAKFMVSIINLHTFITDVVIEEENRLISQLKYISNNVNQLAAAANSGAPVSETAVNSVKAELEKIRLAVNGILSKLTEALREM